MQTRRHCFCHLYSTWSRTNVSSPHPTSHALGSPNSTLPYSPHPMAAFPLKWRKHLTSFFCVHLYPVFDPTQQKWPHAIMNTSIYIFRIFILFFSKQITFIYYTLHGIPEKVISLVAKVTSALSCCNLLTWKSYASKIITNNPVWRRKTDRWNEFTF